MAAGSGSGSRGPGLPLYVVCPSCGRVTSTDTGYCRHCGAPLAPLLGGGGEKYSWDLRVGVTGEGVDAGISLEDLARHVVVYGIVGSGKSSFAKRLVWEASLHGLGFLVIDWEGEYGELARSVGGEVLSTAPGAPRPLGIEVFRSPSPEAVEAYSEWVSGILLGVLREEGWETSPMMELLLRRSVRIAVERGAGIGDLPGIFWELSKTIPQGHLTAAALEARLSRITSGVVSKYLVGPDTLGDPARGRVVVDLSWAARVSPRDARVLAKIVLARLYYSVVSRPRVGERKAWMIVVVEEAEEILPKQSWQGPSSLSGYLMHLRKHGVGVVVVGHSPSLLDPSLRKIAGNIAVFRLEDAEDARIAASMLGVPEAVVKGLERGTAVLRLASRSTPLTVRVDPVEPGKARSVEEAVQALIRSVYTHPHLTLYERRDFLGIDSRVFRAAVEYLVSHRLASIVEVYQGVGRPAKILQPRGMNPSAAHRYMVSRIVSMLSSRGVEAKPVTGPGPDIVAVYKGLRVAVEVETGSNISLGKYEKFLEDYDALVVVCTTRKCIRVARKTLSKTTRPEATAATALSFLPVVLEKLYQRAGAGTGEG